MSKVEQWKPTGIDKIRNALAFDGQVLLKSNIAYNIQYLQYLDREIKNVDTTPVLYKMLYKTFVVTGMAIIEAVFMGILKDRDLMPKEEWKEVGNHKHADIDENTKCTIIVKERVKQYIKKINFDEAISIIEKENVLKLQKNSIDVIRELKNLRNRLHLDKAETFRQSDYNSFNETTYFVMKLILYYVMSNKNISKNKEYLDFLTVYKSEFEKYMGKLM